MTNISCIGQPTSAPAQGHFIVRPSRHLRPFRKGADGNGWAAVSTRESNRGGSLSWRPESCVPFIASIHAIGMAARHS